MEYHPEENNYGEHQQQGNYALLGLLGSKLLDILLSGCGGFGVFFVIDDMSVRLASEEVYEEADNQRHACQTECPGAAVGKAGDVAGGEVAEVRYFHAAAACEVRQIVAQERTQVGARFHAVLGGELGHGLDGFLVLWHVSEVLGVDAPVAHGGGHGVVGEVAGLGKSPVLEAYGSHGSEHRAQVDGHVEQRESRVALVGVALFIIKVAHHYLQVALEQAGTCRNQQQGGKKNHKRGIAAYGSRSRHKGIAHKHHGDTGGYTLGEAPFVGEPATYQRHKIY